LDEASTELKNGNECQIEYERPFSAKAVREDSEEDLYDEIQRVGMSLAKITIINGDLLTAPTDRNNNVNVIAVVYKDNRFSAEARIQGKA
jgi:hypothetical protein